MMVTPVLAIANLFQTQLGVTTGVNQAFDTASFSVPSDKVLHIMSMLGAAGAYGPSMAVHLTTQLNGQAHPHPVPMTFAGQFGQLKKYDVAWQGTIWADAGSAVTLTVVGAKSSIQITFSGVYIPQ
jgi:hypothetical protein